MLELICRWPVDDGPLLATPRPFAGPALAHAIADGVIALSCLSLVVTLAAIAGKLRGLGATRAPLCAGALLTLLAASHLIDARAPWLPAPLAADLLRAGAATAALAAAALLPALIPRAAALARSAGLAHGRGQELAAAHREL